MLDVRPAFAHESVKERLARPGTEFAQQDYVGLLFDQCRTDAEVRV
jgi:hypothetical protein